jgi:hypothetical protein
MYDEKKQKDAQHRERRTLLLLGLEGLGLIVAAFAISFIAGGCGQHQERAAATAPASNQSGVTATAVATTPSTASQTREPQENDPVVDVDSLPPEVSASVQDSVVTPGAAVEITAESSIDATDLVLWDGIGKRQSFVYDLKGKVWRTYYRVPMKSANRLALSVTAKSQGGRWRRVWVFVNVQRPSEVVPEPSPSPSTDEQH